MGRFCFLGLWALLGTFVLGACPGTPSEDSDELTGQAAATAPDNCAGVPDNLSAKFPDCCEPASGPAWRSRVLELLNEERTAAGVCSLVPNQTLEDEASEYACELLQYDFVAHVDPVTGSTLRDRANEFGYQSPTIGENLAAGPKSPDEVVQAWMGSPEHRTNMLEPRFMEVGVGVRTGGRYGVYWVLEFGQGRADALTATFPSCTEPADGAAWRAEVLRLVNEQRTAAGLPLVNLCQKLADQADRYACEMINYGFFGHDNPVTGTSIRDRSVEFGYNGLTLGENIAAGPLSPEAVVGEWMANATWRATLLDARFSEAGIGVRAGGERGLYWVIELGEPR